MRNFIFALLLFSSISYISAISIHDIQYTNNPGFDNTYPSKYVGQKIETSGIITAINSNSREIYIQDGTGAWSGLKIQHTGLKLQIGDKITVKGVVSENHGTTQLKDIEYIHVLSTNNPIPSSTVLSTRQISDSESFEGVLVKVNNITITSKPNHLGEWYVNDGSGACQVDDDFLFINQMNVSISVNDQWESIRGIVDFDHGEYEINPISDNDIMLLSVHVPSSSWGKVKSLYK